MRGINWITQNLKISKNCGNLSFKYERREIKGRKEKNLKKKKRQLALQTE